jgi:hypothetical protein
MGTGDALMVGGNLNVTGALVGGSHTHDARYYTESESDSRYVNVAGDTMTGTLTILRVSYITPRTHYWAVSGDGFVPESNLTYSNSGGAYISSGSGGLVAAVHLPHGAVVTEFRVFFEDNSASNLTVDLLGWTLSGPMVSYMTMAEVTSLGISGYGSAVATGVYPATIDNTVYGYLVRAWCNSWSSSLRIRGAAITYTVSEAE